MTSCNGRLSEMSILCCWTGETTRDTMVKKTLSIPASSDCGLGRVLAGVVGRCRGYPQFISHSSLSYNRFINTEYLQDDCLRFRVNMVTKWLSCIDNKFVYFFQEFTCRLEYHYYCSTIIPQTLFLYALLLIPCAFFFIPLQTAIHDIVLTINGQRALSSELVRRPRASSGIGLRGWGGRGRYHYQQQPQVGVAVGGASVSLQQKHMDTEPVKHHAV